MRKDRRRFLRSSGGLSLLPLMAAAGLLPGFATAEEWNQAAFASRSLDDFFQLLGGSPPQQSDLITLSGPEIVENGAIVPIEISSALPDTESISILVEKNPDVLAGTFTIPRGTLPEIQTRVKMAQTCNVYALVKSHDKFYYRAREVKVTVGGCGG
ncbi:MAG TPA: thiosulfate oxidation carrier protein SoxY [Burkholderiales bacterium]|nr:thiosulfate oxidation carrier protein SoxY [Burkholderiales bacterium]